MQMMAKINAKLDIGWKLTTLSCPTCNSTTMAEPRTQIEEIYCPKCDKKYPIQSQIQEDSQPNNGKIQSAEEQDSSFYEQVYKNYKSAQPTSSSTTANGNQKSYKNEFQLLKAEEISAPFKKTNDVSKKIGEKLLQGWTMLNQSCHDCYVPLMQSKKGEKICCGCNHNFSNLPVNKPETKKVEKVQKIQEGQKKESTVKRQEQKPAKRSPVASNNETLSKPLGRSLQLFERIETKTLEFIEKKLERAILDNDLSQIQRLMSLTYKIKGEFK